MIMFKSSIFFIYLTNYGIKPSMTLIGIYNWLQKRFSLVYFIPYIYIFNLIGLLPYTPCWTTQFFISPDVPQVLQFFLVILTFLSLRIVSNIIDGNYLFYILVDMTLKFIIENMIAIVRLLIIYIIVLFEFIVTFLQTYLFAVLFINYLNNLKKYNNNDI